MQNRNPIISPAHVPDMTAEDFTRICRRLFEHCGDQWKHDVVVILDRTKQMVRGYSSGSRSIPHWIASQVWQWDQWMDAEEAELTEEYRRLLEILRQRMASLGN